MVLRRRAGDDPGAATTALVLAPLAGPVPPTVRAWLDAGQDLRVDGPRRCPSWSGSTCRRWRPTVAVTSRDGSVDIPGPAVVTLRGDVTWSDDGRVELGWRWLYRRGDQAQQFPLDGHEGARGWRDRAAEAALVDRLGWDEDLDTLLGAPAARAGHAHRPASGCATSRRCGSRPATCPGCRPTPTWSS